MIPFFIGFLTCLSAFFRSRHNLSLEILALRQQLGVLKRKQPHPRLRIQDRRFWILLRRLVAFYVEEHNTRLPHSAFRGQTPDEMYYGRGDHVPRGIMEKMARHLLTHLAEDQPVRDQLEWGDYLLKNARPRAFYNPTGLCIHLIQENVLPPEQFETGRQRQLREAARQARDSRELEQARQELAYVGYRKKVVEEFIRLNYTAQEFSELVRRKREELLEMAHWKRVYSLHQGAFDSVAERQLKADLAGRIGILSFAEFQKADSSSQGTVTAWDPEDSDSTPWPSSEETQQTEPLKS
jgi:hypothetical protein